MPAEFERGAKFVRLERNLEKPDAALRQIGTLMVAESQQAFREQKHGKNPWDKRRVPNIMGIIADFHAGVRTPPARRFEARPALRDTGRLAGSIDYKLVADNVVEVGSNLPYAAVLHSGGTVESKPITEQVRTLLAEFLRGPGKAHRKSLGWILNPKFAGRTIRGKVPARPIVGITKQTIDDVLEVVAVKIMEAT